MSLDSTPDRHRWTFAGHRVTQVAVELDGARLQSWALDASLDVRLGTAFTVRLADGTERSIDPHHPEQVAPLLTLLTRTIETLIVARSGTLVVSFSDGTEIRAASHPTIPAFEVQGGGALEGLAYVAVPGGGPLWPD